MSLKKLHLLAILLGFTSVIQAQTYLGYNLKVGDSLKISQISKQEIVQKMNDQEHKIVNNLGGDYLFYVKSETDSSYVIDFKYDSFFMKTTSNLAGPIFDVDTRKEISEDDVEGKIFKGLTETALEINMLKTGKIVSLVGTEDLINNMIDDLGLDSFTMEVMRESMRKEFGGESLIESLGQFTYMYPDKTVNIGNSWQNKFKGDMKADNTWQLDSVDENLNISCNSDIALTSQEENLTMILQGTQKSEITSDKVTGWPIDAKITSTAKGISIMQGMESVEIPTTIISTTTYKPFK